jgi:hypothetical protein
MDKCQGQLGSPQKGQVGFPQIKSSVDGLALLLQVGQLGEDTSSALFAQPVPLAAEVDGSGETQQPVQDGCYQNLIGEDVTPLPVGLV